MYARFFLTILLCLPITAAHAQDIKDGIDVYTLNDYRQGKVKTCPIISGPIGMKIYNHNNASPPLTDAEYRALAGNTDLFAIQGGLNFYSRKARKVIPTVEAYMTLNGYDVKDIKNPAFYKNPKALATMQNYNPDTSMSGDIPLLCGDGSVETNIAQLQTKERKRKEKEKAEYAKNCTLCTLSGGDYLEAIYTGNFVKQNTLAANYLSQIARSGGSEIMAVGALINMTGGQGNDFTYLEDVIGYYMLASSRKWNNQSQCYPAGANKVTFTTTYPEQVYETLGGVEVGRDAAVTNVTHYTVKPSFGGACNKICNKNGGLLLTARLAQASGGTMSALQVFKGIDQMLDTKKCNTQAIQTFEQNLLKLWAQEKNQSRSLPRNTIGSYFR